MNDELSIIRLIAEASIAVQIVIALLILVPLMPTLPPGCRVLVVADNCTDSTAAIARECGAEVVERNDSGKLHQNA